ncbi:hypothetical protein VST7929_01207 [Vibrio stylophorae]|uniref:Uncharacterized protein n=1 Tax=Vibrio stylophorae TaxID=659351 RepID=A0ABM8ZSQ9_9VIBR|nr:hypothetical protein [Vibrio stylophorae]CAH0533341.1 hypothetical protein VST7929_01207 [Vibrio stylophorae]
MKASHYGAVLVRLFAMALAYHALDRLTLMMLMGFDNINYHNVWNMFVYPLIPIVIALLLWFFPLTVSQFLVREDFDHQVELMSVGTILMVLLLAVGIFLLYHAIMNALYWVVVLPYRTQLDEYGVPAISFSPFDISNMIVAGLELIVSLLLVFRARYFARLLLRVVR